MFNVCVWEANSISAGWGAVRDINILCPNGSPVFRITLRSLLSSAHWHILLLGFRRLKSFANRNGTFKAFGCLGQKLLWLEDLQQSLAQALVISCSVTVKAVWSSRLLLQCSQRIFWHTCLPDRGHLKHFEVILLGLASETSKAYLQKGKRGFGSGGHSVSWWDAPVGAAEGEISAYRHFQRGRASRCCFLGIPPFTDRGASWKLLC